MLPSGALVFAYLDDIYVVCRPEAVRDCFGIVQEVLQRVCHIDIHLGKLAAWSRQEALAPDGVNDLRPSTTAEEAPVWKSNLPRHQRGIKIVGTPLGTPEFISAVGQEVVEEEAQLLQQMPQLTSLQIAWLILYFCAVPRVTISCAPSPHHWSEALLQVMMKAS